MLTRAALIGDVHAETVRLRAALAHVADTVDAVLCVGDIVDGPGDVNETCDILRAAEVLAVRGNHDRWLLSGEMRELPDAHPVAQLSSASRAFLSALPATRELATAAGQLLLCHGLGEDDMMGLHPDDDDFLVKVNVPLQRLLENHRFDIVVNGHTHRRMVRTVGTLTIINAGTLHRRYAPGFLVADFAARSVLAFDVDGEGQVTEAERINF
jgi:predicted phosphodiesterase